MVSYISILINKTTVQVRKAMEEERGGRGCRTHPVREKFKNPHFRPQRKRGGKGGGGRRTHPSSR
jgi:hypothetical protein